MSSLSRTSRRSNPVRYTCMIGRLSGLPTAARLIFVAAAMYRAISAGVIESTAALLSNPKPAMSLGSSAEPSISSASKSSMALAYSTRFIRRATTRPGLGSAAATRSSAVSSEVAKASMVAASGRGRPSGGICPLRSLCTTFSSTSAFAATFPMSSWSSMRPAVCNRSLWQLTQYRSKSSREGGRATGAAASVHCDDWFAAVAPAAWTWASCRDTPPAS